MTLREVDHKFANAQLSYSATPNNQPCIKLSFFFHKLPGVSYEHFHRHWETVHADLTVAAKDFKIHKIQRYVQVHQTPELKLKAESLGIPHMDFDGCSEIWVRSWEDWEAFFKSPEFGKALHPDCDNFMQLPFQVMVGYENLIYGESVPGAGGKDGIMPSDLKSSE